MAEKELRKDINEITGEIEEVKAELMARLAKFKKLLKPAVIGVAGLIGLKIALKLLRVFLALFWKLKLPILIMLFLVFLKFYRHQSGGQCSR